MQATYITNNSFSVSGNKILEFVSGRRVKATHSDSTQYCTIYASTISGSYTVVTLKENELTSNLTSILYGAVEPGISGSLPDHNHDGSEGSGGTISINEDMTLYLSVSGSNTVGNGSSGNPWQTFFAAWDYLSDRIIKTDKNVTIKYMDGTHTVSGTITNTFHPNGSQITISGDTVLDRNITSVQSSSGSANNYSIVFNVDTTSGVEVGDYIIVTKEAANGTNPTYACGCHEITNVDTGNTRITVTSKHGKGAPSGAVTSTIRVFKTILSCTDGFVLVTLPGAVLNLRDFVAVGGSSNYGIYTDNKSAVICSAPIGIAGFGYGLAVGAGSYVNFDTCGASGANNYCVFGNSGFLFMRSAVMSGTITSHGVLSYYGSTIDANYSISTGHSKQGYYCSYNSVIVAIDSSSTGNGSYGWYALYNAGIRRTGTCTGGNNTSGDTGTSNGGYVQV